jgi:hypothetical protein
MTVNNLCIQVPIKDKYAIMKAAKIFNTTEVPEMELWT